MKRLKLRVFVFLVLRANITEYSQSNSSHVRLPLKWGGSIRSILPPYLTECTFKLLMFASEYSRQQVHNRLVIPKLEGSFSYKKATLWQTKTGAISPTGDWRAAAKSGQTVRELLSRFLQLLSTGSMIKSTTGMGSKFRSIAVANVRGARACV